MGAEQILTNRPLPGARVNMAHPLALDLRGCWFLNETGGLRAMDCSPYGNHGLLAGFPLAGRPFNGLYFDGANTNIAVPDATSIAAFPNGITLEAWVMPKATMTDNGILYKGEKSVSNGDWVMRIAASSRIVISFNNVTAVHTGAVGITDTAHIYHIVGTYDLGKVSLFMDGQADGNTAYTTALTPSAFGAEIGMYFSTSYRFTGFIYLVRIWGRALSADEVKNLYISPYKPMGLPFFL